MAERESNFKSYKNRIEDFGIKQGSFVNDTGERVNYKQTVLILSIDGDSEEIVLSGKSAPSPKVLGAMLRGASKTTVSGNMLDDEDEQ